MSHDFTQHEPFNFVISVEGLPKKIKTLKVHKKQNKETKSSFCSKRNFIDEKKFL